MNKKYEWNEIFLWKMIVKWTYSEFSTSWNCSAKNFISVKSIISKKVQFSSQIDWLDPIFPSSGETSNEHMHNFTWAKNKVLDLNLVRCGFFGEVLFQTMFLFLFCLMWRLKYMALFEAIIQWTLQILCKGRDSFAHVFEEYQFPGCFCISICFAVMLCHC